MRDKNKQYERMAETILKSSTNDSTSKWFNAEKMLSVFNAYYLKKSYDADSKAAYIFEHFPREIVYGFNMLVMDLESLAALFARGSIVDNFLKEADANMVTRDVCSVLRSMLGVTFAGLYPEPDVIFSSNHPCNGYYKVVQQIAKMYGNKPVYEFMVPSEAAIENISFVAEQLKQLVTTIENDTGIRFDTDSFKASIEASNTARDYYQKTAELLKEQSIRGLPNALMQISSISPWGAKEIVKICRRLYEEANSAEKLPIHRRRVIWIGQIPYHGSQLIQYLEERFEILYRPSLSDLDFRIDEDAPFQSIAKNLICATWNHSRITESILALSTDYKAKLVILQNPWGCRNFIGMNSIVRDSIRKKGIKVLVIDNDFMDSTKVSFAQVKNRIDAFAEIFGEGV